MDSLTPGTIVGPPSLHDPARNIRFGVVQAPPMSDRVKRIISDDPDVWKPAVGEAVEAAWSKHESDRVQAQLIRWGIPVGPNGQPGYMKRKADPSKPEGYRYDFEPLTPDQLRSGLWLLDVPMEDEEERQHRGLWASGDDELEAL
jgi:hypothetical protein